MCGKSMEINRVMFEGLSRVDNENNNQSRYSNMSNAYMSGSLIYGIGEDIALGVGTLEARKRNISKAMCTGRGDTGIHTRPRESQEPSSAPKLSFVHQVLTFPIVL